MKDRERAQQYIELANGTTSGPWFSGTRGGQCHIDHIHGNGDCAYDLILYPSDDWFETTVQDDEIWEYNYESTRLKNSRDAKFIAASRTEGPYFAQRLLDALDLLEWVATFENVSLKSCDINVKELGEVARQFLEGSEE